MSLTRNFAHFVANHFRLYRTLTPWAFCWRITIEGTTVSLLLAMGLMAFDLEQRDIPFNNAMFFIVGVFVAPVPETLLLQSFPVFIARLFKARFSIQVLSSLVPFAFLHFLEGIQTGLAAGLVGGGYLAFTYVHWRGVSRWSSFWITALSHAIRNALLISCFIVLESFIQYPSFNDDAHAIDRPHVIVNRYNGIEYRSQLSVDQIRKMPSWDPQRKTRPPLSPGDALTAANQIALKLFPEMTWENATISMGPLGHVQDHRKWVYSVKYFDKVENEADKSFTLNAFLVVVRMDGVAVEPEIVEELTGPSQGTNNINSIP